MGTRILMIGLDGADGHLLDQYSADGTLPNLAALRGRGSMRRLTAPPGLTDDALWASFQYSVDLGEHGRYLYWLEGKGGQLTKAYWHEGGHVAFWDELSDQGNRVAIFDIPKSRNPRPINGIHLVDWLVHGRYFPRPRSQPTSLSKDVLEKFGAAPLSRCNYLRYGSRDEEIGEISGNWRTSIAMKRDAGLHYLASEEWDLFAIGFKEAHCANHAFFDLDLRHPAHDPSIMNRLGDPMMTVLQGLDDAIGDLVVEAGPSAQVLVFSPTDFVANGSLDHLMPLIVERLNALLAAPDKSGFGRSAGQSDSGPSRFQCAVLHYNDNCAALRVTRQGEAPRAGSNFAGSSFEAALRLIEAEVLGLRDAETQQPVVSQVTRPSTELTGSRAHQLPDLLIHWASGLFSSAVTSPTLGRFEGEAPIMRSGNHAPGGIVIGAGSQLAGAIANVRTVADLGGLAKAVVNRTG
ncbi:MAG: alkaline phosphatase family protein [Sphingomonadaceae bacterium]|nr:alkaline phosphatase family protein [Sphingomonadaceae bacterium]